MTTYGFDESGVRRIVKVVRQVENAPRQTPGNYEPIVSSGTSETWLECKNNAGETIPAYSAVNLTAGTTVDGRKIPYAVKPSTTFYAQWGMTVGQDVESGAKLGVCMEHGLVRYDTGTPAAGEGWGIKPGQYTLSKGYPGGRVIEVLDTTNKIMRVEWLPLTHFLGKTEVSVSAGASLSGAVAGAYKIYGGTKGSESDGGWTTVPSVWFRNALGASKWFRATWLNDGWEGEPLTC